MKNMKKIALIQGGLGAERDVSYVTGQSFAGALKELGYPFEVVEADEKLPVTLAQSGADVALLAVHGKYAEDGIVQALCEYLKIPYTGAGVLSSALCMDKAFSKQVFQYHQIPTPTFVVWGEEDQELKRLPFAFPWVIKPSREGSSLGIHIVENQEDFSSKFREALQYDRFVLVESLIKGMEVTVPVWLGRPLTAIEIAPKTDFFNYENKYTKGCTDYHVPARLDVETLDLCRELAVKACESCRVRTYGRVDFMVSEEGSQPYVLEINTLPGFTPTSLLPMSAQHEGVSFVELVRELIEHASLDYAGVK